MNEENFIRGRVYEATPMTIDRAMVYAMAPGGLSGGSSTVWPESYVALRSWLTNPDERPPSSATQRAIGTLLRRGWIELRERVVHVPADTSSGMFEAPAHVVTMRTYFATERGRNGKR